MIALAQGPEAPWYSAGGWVFGLAVILLVVLVVVGNWRRRR